jgi:thiol-disulfide isomerase/thioredoxin
MITRRRIGLALAAGTVAAAAPPGKSIAGMLAPAAGGLEPVVPPVAPPDVAFTDANGAAHHLSDFKGHGMVVNLWATWCAPCVAEMPSLAALAKALAPQDIAVLPLCSDHGGAGVVEDWYRQHGITALPVLLDRNGAMAHAFRVRGIPTTIIIDTAGMVVARLEGAADWAAPDSQALVRKLVTA